MVASKLMSIDEVQLSTWFVDKYIQKCAQYCPDYVQHLFDDTNTIIKLQKAVSAIVDFTLNTSLHDLFNTAYSIQYSLSQFLSHHKLTVQLCVCWMSKLTKCDNNVHLLECFIAVAFLAVAHKMTTNDFDDTVIDVLATLLGHFNDTQPYFKQHYCKLSLNNAVKLMKVAANRPKFISTVQLIQIKMSKAYLYRALKCTDSDSDSIYCLANVYLAVLYYITGHYQTAIDHCTLVTKSQDHSQCSSHVVQGEVLPKIDDDIDSTLGLTVFYQYVLLAALNQQQQRQYVSVFTMELFAHYLLCRLLLVTQCRQVTPTSLSGVGLALYAKRISEIHQLFIGDVLVVTLLKKAIEPSGSTRPHWSKFCHFCIPGNAKEQNTSELVELLQQFAVEKLTSLRQLEVQDFSSVATIVTTDFETLYMYKHGKCQQCLQVSTQNVRTLLYADEMPTVSTLPVFTRWMMTLSH